MFHGNRNSMVLMLAIGVAAVVLAVGVNPLYLLLLACPLMMVFMMGAMGAGKDHAEGGSKHDHPAQPHS